MVAAAGIADTICAMVLLIAGVMKIGSLSQFGLQIAAYQIVPTWTSKMAGYALPPAEIVVGASLFLLPQLSVAAIFLFVSFAIAVGVNLLRGRTELRCGCFGATGRHTISRAHLAGNLCLAFLAFLTLTEGHRPTLPAFQIGVSAILLVLLASAWRAMASLSRKNTGEAPQP
jgi:hypothetical protein